MLGARLSSGRRRRQRLAQRAARRGGGGGRGDQGGGRMGLILQFVDVDPLFITAQMAWSVKCLPVMQETACSAGYADSTPGSERSLGEGNGCPPQYSCLGNPMDRKAWWATALGAKESDMT